jgi:hypothetical protein
MKYRATYEALQKISPDVLLQTKERYGAMYREEIGRALLRAGMWQMIELTEVSR